MSNPDKINLLRELLQANGLSSDMIDSIMEPAETLMNTLGLDPEEIFQTFFSTNQRYDEPLTTDALMALEDSELVNTMGYQLDVRFQNEEPLTDAQVTVLTLALLDMEVMNGGLCQFFVNAGRHAHRAPDALKTVGATAYIPLLEDFVKRHQLDLTDLSEFELTRESDEEDFTSYRRLTEKYPFDDFDDAYGQLSETDPLEGYITKYIRAHVDAFAEE